MAGLAPFEAAPLLALGVSGGPDSMALAVLAARWARARGGRAVALLVDHGLRPEAAGEIALAAAALRPLGVEARLLKVAAPAPARGKPAWARAERYRLFIQAMREIGGLHLLLAHHRDDQAETLLLQLARGSGVKGLAAMPAVRPGSDFRVVRPLLAVPKARLIAAAAAADLPVADDPSNRDEAYARTRTRQALAETGDAARLAETARRLASEDRALEQWTAALAARALRLSPLGLIEIDRAHLTAAPDAVALRLLARAAHAVGGRSAPPRQARSGAALAALRAGGACRRTLAGAMIDADAARVRIWRTPDGKNVKPPVLALDAVRESRFAPVWDGRFRVFVEGPAPAGAVVAALGYGGLRSVEAMAAPPDWLGAAPRRALIGLPALWSDRELLAAATIGAGPEGRSRFAAGLAPDAKSRLRLGAVFQPRRPVAPAASC